MLKAKTIESGNISNNVPTSTEPDKESSDSDKDSGIKSMTNPQKPAKTMNTGSMKGKPGKYAPETAYPYLNEISSVMSIPSKNSGINKETESFKEKKHKHGTIEPTGNPTINKNAKWDATRPSDDSPGVEYDYVQTDATKNLWSIKVTKLFVNGTIEIWPWPNLPHKMVTPHNFNTPNVKEKPYNIVGAESLADHPNWEINVWDYVVNQLEDYGTVHGSGPQWHSTEASEAHEMHHWNTDIMVNCINAGDWPATQTAMESVSVEAIDKADAEAKLTPQVEQIFDAFRTRFADYYMNVMAKNDVPKTPMDGAYAAGKKVLEGYIKDIKKAAKKEKWKKRNE